MMKRLFCWAVKPNRRWLWHIPVIFKTWTYTCTAAS